MKPEALYLKEISTPSKEFDAMRFLREVMSQEIERLRHASMFSSLHEYVTQHGYPIQKEQLRDSSYVNRAGYERELHEAISTSSNLYLIGCEGSGKTTLLHYVISEYFEQYRSIFSYVDASDIGIGIGSPFFTEVLLDKIRNALFLAFTTDLRQEFVVWRNSFSSDPFAASLVDVSNTKRMVESMMIFLNSRPSLGCVYFIIDNVDSLKSGAVEELFATLHLLEESVSSAFHTLKNQANFNRLRFIVSCRTQSVEIVTSASVGLFTKSPFVTLDMDARFSEETDVLSLTHSFLSKEKQYIFRQRGSITVPAHFGSVGWNTFDDYSEDIFQWLSRSKVEVNHAVAKFCGRSIRRSKLFIVKALASPVIARLAFFENHRIYNITRDDPEYLERRMLEALFDFSTSAALQLPGNPLNPFKVLRDDRTFRDNPLIGVVTLFYIHETIDRLRVEDVHFAQSIDARPIVEYLKSIRYDREAILECFHSIVLSSLLRPINGAKIVIEDEESDRKIVDRYILDHNALRAYIDLLLFRKWSSSLTFYNMALRARYEIRGDRHLDNLAYELYTFLVFLSDLLDREMALETQIRGTNVMFRPLSARIRQTVFSALQNEMEKATSDRTRGNVRREQSELVTRAKEMLDDLRWRLSRHAGII